MVPFEYLVLYAWTHKAHVRAHVTQLIWNLSVTTRRIEREYSVNLKECTTAESWKGIHHEMRRGTGSDY